MAQQWPHHAPQPGSFEGRFLAALESIVKSSEQIAQSLALFEQAYVANGHLAIQSKTTPELDDQIRRLIQVLEGMRIIMEQQQPWR